MLIQKKLERKFQQELEKVRRVPLSAGKEIAETLQVEKALLQAEKEKEALLAEKAALEKENAALQTANSALQAESKVAGILAKMQLQQDNIEKTHSSALEKVTVSMKEQVK